jgi:hypothetical protein
MGFAAFLDRRRQKDQTTRNMPITIPRMTPMTAMSHVGILFLPPGFEGLEGVDVVLETGE